MTTSKTLVKQAIEFRNPERVPYNFDSNRTPVIAEKYGDDFEWVFSQEDPDFKPRVKRDDCYEDGFGVVYERFGRAFGDGKEYPLADPASANRYRLPDFTKAVRFRVWRPRGRLPGQNLPATESDRYSRTEHQIHVRGVQNVWALCAQFLTVVCTRQIRMPAGRER